MNENGILKKEKKNTSLVSDMRVGSEMREVEAFSGLDRCIVFGDVVFLFIISCYYFYSMNEIENYYSGAMIGPLVASPPSDMPLTNL